MFEGYIYIINYFFIFFTRILRDTAGERTGYYTYNIIYILYYINVFVSVQSTIKSGFDNDLDVTSVLLSRLYGQSACDVSLSFFILFYFIVLSNGQC